MPTAPVRAIVDTTSTNISTSVHYIHFDFADDVGNVSTGIDTSRIQLTLIVNKSLTLTITVNGNTLSVSNSTLAKDFSLVTNDGSSLLIAWNASDIEKYDVIKTHDNKTIDITWRVISLYDNYGNALDTSTISPNINYHIFIEALPPEPNLLVELATIVATFAVFIGVGIGAAFLYEKIRYVG